MAQGLTAEERMKRIQELIEESRESTVHSKRTAKGDDGPQKKKQKIDNELLPRYFEFTIWLNAAPEEPPREPYTKEYVRDLLSDELRAVKFVFQTEKSPKNGHLHFQGRAYLGKNHEIPKSALVRPGFFITPTSGNGIKTWSYVMKDDTRVDGPWSNETLVKPPPEVREDPNFQFMRRMWMIKLWAKLDEEYAQRKNNCWLKKIFWVYDGPGKMGKTHMHQVLTYFHRYLDIETVFDTAQQLSGCIVSKVGHLEAGTGFAGLAIDIPRNASKWKAEKKAALYEVLEKARGGKASDARGSYKGAVFGSCPVVVFANFKPRADDFSHGRLYLVDISGISLEDDPWIDMRTLGQTPPKPAVEDVPDFRGDPSQRMDEDGFSEEEIAMMMAEDELEDTESHQTTVFSDSNESD